jgi:RHS repeat-associated protein
VGFGTYCFQRILLSRYVYAALWLSTKLVLRSDFLLVSHARLAEYNEATGALIREHVWRGGEPVAVIEGGVTNLIRTDHIGRPVFATNPTGVKTWTASYDPFGGVRTTTGAPISARFPGQWFRSESGLHQNWMRDYDPTTGRYLQADPLGLVDGSSVYGYAMQSPMMYTDPRGEEIPGTGLRPGQSSPGSAANDNCPIPGRCKIWSSMDEPYLRQRGYMAGYTPGLLCIYYCPAEDAWGKITYTIRWSVCKPVVNIVETNPLTPEDLLITSP